jgi:hypothetical protein
MKPAPIAFAGTIRAAQLPDHARIAELAGQLSYPSTPEEMRALRSADWLWMNDSVRRESATVCWRARKNGRAGLAARQSACART